MVLMVAAESIGNLVRFEQVTKECPAGGTTFKAVNAVSMDVADGGFVIMLGPSGSGKTAVLNIMPALVKPTSGKVFVGARRLPRSPMPWLRGSERRR